MHDGMSILCRTLEHQHPCTRFNIFAIQHVEVQLIIIALSEQPIGKIDLTTT